MWQRLHDKMWLMVNSGSWLKKQLFSWGVSSKIATVRVFITFFYFPLLFLYINNIIRQEEAHLSGIPFYSHKQRPNWEVVSSGSFLDLPH